MKNLHNIPEIGNFAAENRINTSSMKRIVFATGNSGKLREASEILGGAFELVTPAQSGISGDIPESGATLRANSLQKAQYIYDHTGGADCFADDTGLEVDALGGRPGVHTARYAFPDRHDPEANTLKLLDELKDADTRTARFRTAIALILDGKEYLFEGVVEGEIATEQRGTEGFGYDPVFIPENLGKTFAELGVEVKNGISHRARAVAKLAAFLLKG